MNIQWNEIWKNQLIQSSMPKPDAYNNWWDSVESARRYLKDYGRRDEKGFDRIAWSIEQLPLKPDSRVLEIGSGPGVLSIPIAKQVNHVTVVDTSAGMLQVLHEYAEREGVSNIRSIQKRWEDISDNDISSTFDVVFASLSLGMPEIQAAIEKMNRYTTGSVILIWFADEPGFEKIYRLILPEISGMPHSPMPRADILFNLVYSMGFFPEVTYGKFSLSQKFADEQEISDFFHYQHHITYQKDAEVYRRYVSEHMKKTESGFEHEENYHCMVLRWNV